MELEKMIANVQVVPRIENWRKKKLILYDKRSLQNYKEAFEVILLVSKAKD